MFFYLLVFYGSYFIPSHTETWLYLELSALLAYCISTAIIATEQLKCKCSLEDVYAEALLVLNPRCHDFKIRIPIALNNATDSESELLNF